MKHSLRGIIIGGALLMTVAASQTAGVAAVGGSGSSSGSTGVIGKPGVGTAKRGGVTISPAFQQISLKPEQASQTFDFSVTNNSAIEHEFALSVVDFGTLDESGGVLFVGNAEKALSYRYALSPWVTLEKDRIVVPPHATEKVLVTLINKESLTPGGHYGAVLVTPTEIGATKDQKVQIDQVATSLLFVKKQGGEVYDLKLSSFKIRPHLFSLPVKLELRFQNAGNVHVIPHGIATLTNPRGVVVKRGIVNADSGIVLPESFRGFSIPLESVGKSWLPGRYKLVITYRYDDVATARTVETTFIYLNAFFMLFVGLLLAGIIILAVKQTLRRRATMSLRQIVGRLQQLLKRLIKR